MRKFLLAGCGVLLLTSIAMSQKTVSENTLLWQVSGNGLKQPSYLFGTMHLMCAADTRLSETLKTVIKESDEIYFEIDMDNFMEMLGAMKYLKMNGNKKLQDFLTAEEYQKVKDYFTKNPGIMTLEMMQYFKPYFISSMISEKAMACANDGGMEQSIMEESKQYKKEIKGLETVAFQASVFDSIPYELQAKELVKYLDSADQNIENTKELIAVYKSQNLKKIQELTEKEEGSTSQFMDLLLYNRNTDWVQKINNIIPAGKVLFAVGAAHLPGEKGLINLLKKKGYTLKPMDNRQGLTL